MPKSKARKNVDENFKVAAVQRCKPAACRRTTSPRSWASAFGHCAGGRENIVREQRQKRAQQANPPCLRPHLGNQFHSGPLLYHIKEVMFSAAGRKRDLRRVLVCECFLAFLIWPW